MISLLRAPLRVGRDVTNICSASLCGRKVFTVDQRSYWQARARNWRQEVEAVAQDPYYVALDRRLIATLGGLGNARSFLEVGCFVGYRLSKVGAALRSATVVGADVVFDALRVAWDAPAERLPRRLVNGDAICLPFRSGAVDCVYTVACLTHIPERMVSRALDEMLRVSRRYLVLIEVYDRPMGLAKRFQARCWGGGYCHPYETLLARPGLTRVRVEGLYDQAGHPRYTLFVYRKETP